jgi:hypothetical protein
MAALSRRRLAVAALDRQNALDADAAQAGN